jgi:hypothetical protein
MEQDEMAVGVDQPVASPVRRAAWEGKKLINQYPMVCLFFDLNCFA